MRESLSAAAGSCFGLPKIRGLGLVAEADVEAGGKDCDFHLVAESVVDRRSPNHVDILSEIVHKRCNLVGFAHHERMLGFLRVVQVEEETL